MASNIEDSSIYEPGRFNKYVSPDIYIDDSLILGPERFKKHVESETRSDQTHNLQALPDGAQATRKNAEWVAGPDRDTTWDKALSWVQNLTVDGGGWRMATVEELKTLHQQDDTFLLSSTTGRWVWSADTKGSSGWLFSFRYGIDKWAKCSQAKEHRAFAIRYRKK